MRSMLGIVAEYHAGAVSDWLTASAHTKAEEEWLKNCVS